MADWVPGLTAPQFQEIASAIGGLGYSSITTSEHLAMPYEEVPLSGGRLDVSVGVGHAVREFEVLGVPFDERGGITDEILESTLVLRAEDKPSHHSAHFDIDGWPLNQSQSTPPGPPSS